MEVYAHRCRGFGHREQSVRAIRAALSSAADGIHVAVMLTKDRKWVAVHAPHHDDDGHQSRRVRRNTFARLKREVLSLDSVLALFSALGRNKTLILEVLDRGEARQLVRLLQRHSVIPDVVVTSWEKDVLRSVHGEDPSLRLGLSFVPVHERVKRLKRVADRPYVLAELPSLPLWSIHVNALLCTGNLVAEAHGRGLKVFAGIVNRRLTRTLMERRDVDAILTDYPRFFTG